MNESARLIYKFANTRASSVRTIMIARRAHDISSDTHTATPLLQHNSAADDRADSCNNFAGGDGNRDQLLIFTKGSWTFTPHQVAIKLMPCSAAELLSQQRAREDDMETRDFGPNDDDADDDGVDQTIELHGHIIGMNLSPDHRLASPLACIVVFVFLCVMTFFMLCVSN